MQHKVPDEDTSEIKHDSRLLVDRCRSLAAFHTTPYKRGYCETGIHRTCCKFALKLMSRKPTPGSGRPLVHRPDGLCECINPTHAGHSVRQLCSFGWPYAHNLDQTQIWRYLGAHCHIIQHSLSGFCFHPSSRFQFGKHPTLQTHDAEDTILLPNKVVWSVGFSNPPLVQHNQTVIVDD